jgi:hypothetical protein
MSRNWIITLIVVVAAYFVWRRFGGEIKGAISSATS